MILYSIAQFWHSSYSRHLLVRINAIFSLILNVGALGVLYYKIQPFSYLTEFGTIPLHYNIYFGIDVFGMWYTVFIIPLIGILVMFVNNILAFLLFHRERLLSWFLVFSQSLVSIVLFAAALFVVLLNS